MAYVANLAVRSYATLVYSQCAFERCSTSALDYYLGNDIDVDPNFDSNMRFAVVNRVITSINSVQRISFAIYILVSLRKDNEFIDSRLRICTIF